MTRQNETLSDNTFEAPNFLSFRNQQQTLCQTKHAADSQRCERETFLRRVFHCGAEFLTVSRQLNSAKSINYFNIKFSVWIIALPVARTPSSQSPNAAQCLLIASESTALFLISRSRIAKQKFFLRNFLGNRSMMQRVYKFPEKLFRFFPPTNLLQLWWNYLRLWQDSQTFLWSKLWAQRGRSLESHPHIDEGGNNQWQANWIANDVSLIVRVNDKLIIPPLILIEFQTTEHVVH